MKSQLELSEIKKLIDDRTLVLLILGFADKQSDDLKNIELSDERAQAVMGALRDQLGIQKDTYIVAMGGTNVLDSGELVKNRVVEVWAVLP